MFELMFGSRNAHILKTPSSLFVIRVNRLHPEPSLFLYSLIFLFTFLLSLLVTYFFQLSFTEKILKFCSGPK